jgi:hypothetical protein
MDLSFHFSLGWGAILIVMVAVAVIVVFRALYS